MSLHKLTAWSGYDYSRCTWDVHAMHRSLPWTRPTRGTRLSARVDVSSSSVVGGQACAYGDAGRQDRHQHPHVMVETPDGKRKRSYTIRAIPHQDPQQEAERLKAVHEARVKIVPRV